jgi:hypothetical protein
MHCGIPVCMVGIHQTTDNAQHNVGVITDTLVDCDGVIYFCPFYDLYEYESRTFAFVPHDFAGSPLLCYLKAISIFEILLCVTKRFQLTTEFT